MAGRLSAIRNTTPDLIASAELVIEIMSPGERRGEKLPFYAEWNVAEYAELDPATDTIRLLANRDGEWTPIDASEVLDLTIAELADLLCADRSARSPTLQRQTD